MSDISAFLANNYIWFLVAGIILIFALIGYIVDSKNIVQEKPKTMKIDSDTIKEEVKDIPVSKPIEKEEEIKPAAPINDRTEILETINVQDEPKKETTEPLIKEENKTESTFEK